MHWERYKLHLNIGWLLNLPNVPSRLNIHQSFNHIVPFTSHLEPTTIIGSGRSTLPIPMIIRVMRNVKSQRTPIHAGNAVFLTVEIDCYITLTTYEIRHITLHCIRRKGTVYITGNRLDNLPGLVLAPELCFQN